MKLTKVQITKFQSIQDSGEFDINDVTCLVGKNEAGKTALLKALYRLNPVVEEDVEYNVTLDYPRRAVRDYKDQVEAGNREPAEVIEATYVLESDDITTVEGTFGSDCFGDETPTITLHKGYSSEMQFSGLNIDENTVLKNLVEAAGLSHGLTAQLLDQEKSEAMEEVLESVEQTEAVEYLRSMLQEIGEQGVSGVVYDRILFERIPKFLYFDEYYQMKGQDNLDALRQRVEENCLENSDYPLLGLIELAGLDLDELVDPQQTEALLASLEAAENQLTQRVLTYWSQNRHLRMKFDIRPGRPGDPEGMTSGMNILGRVHDTKHMVSTPLGTRSRGFVWFFSFLAWYSQLRKKGGELILLLDEPGLSLHAKAQEDLLRYFEKELRPHHQLIYTTHSPFMVDPTHFDRVRIVQDPTLEEDSDDLPEDQQGTKVITEVLDATPDSLFPLQGALGYEIYQTLFLGPNCLVVEGVSDLLYIQTISAILQKNGKEGLNSDWTITPVGGSDKVPTFVALIGAQSNLNLAVLIDYQKKDQQKIEDLYKRKLMKKKNVHTFAEYVQRPEADIEDMFEPELYLVLVNGAYDTSIELADVSENHPRIIRRLEEYLETAPLPNDAVFNHYRPARYLSENIGSLEDKFSKQELSRFEEAFKSLNALL